MGIKIKILGLLLLAITPLTTNAAEDLPPVCDPLLTKAVIEDRSDDVRILVQWNKNVTANCIFTTQIDHSIYPNITPLSFSAIRLKVKTIKSLLAGAKTDVNIKDPADGGTALHRVAYYSENQDELFQKQVFEAAVELLDNDANYKMADKNGSVPEIMNPELIEKALRFLNRSTRDDLMGRTAKAKAKLKAKTEKAEKAERKAQARADKKRLKELMEEAERNKVEF